VAFNNEPKNFLVRIGEMFFAGFDKKWKPLAIAAPSISMHMNYGKADSICQWLIANGYKDVCVTNLIGTPADLEIIHEQLSASVS